MSGRYELPSKWRGSSRAAPPLLALDTSRDSIHSLSVAQGKIEIVGQVELHFSPSCCKNIISKTARKKSGSRVCLWFLLLPVTETEKRPLRYCARCSCRGSPQGLIKPPSALQSWGPPCCKRGATRWLAAQRTQRGYRGRYKPHTGSPGVQAALSEGSPGV